MAQALPLPDRAIRMNKGGADGVWVPWATFKAMAEAHIALPGLRRERDSLTLEVKDLRLSIDALRAAEGLLRARGDKLQLAYDSEHKELIRILSKRTEPKLSDRLLPIAWTFLGAALAAAIFALSRPLAGLWSQ